MLTTPTNESRLLGPQMQPPAATNQPPAATPASLFDLAVTKATPVFSLAWQPKASSARHRTRWRQATQQTKIERPFHRFPWLWFRDTRPTAVRRQSRRPNGSARHQPAGSGRHRRIRRWGTGKGRWGMAWPMAWRWGVVHHGSMVYSLWCGSMAYSLWLWVDGIFTMVWVDGDHLLTIRSKLCE